MIKGIVLGKCVWDPDAIYSKFWDTKKYGIDVDTVLELPRQLLEMKDPGDHTFLIATDLWTPNAREAAEHAKNNLGLKIFFFPREILRFHFKNERFLYKGECYFKPDVVFSPGDNYSDIWKGNAETCVTGHPRFDYCHYDKWADRKEVLNSIGVDDKKKILFFPSYQIYLPTSKHVHDYNNWEKWFADIFDEREELLSTLLEISNKRGDLCVIVKMHPMTSAVFRKRGETKDIDGITMDYFKNPTDNFIVINSGENETRKISRDLMSAMDYMVGVNSTMLSEAALMKKQVIRVNMGISDRLVKSDGYDKIFHNVSGKNNVIDSINNMLDGKASYYANYNVLNKYILSDLDSCERICGCIKKHMEG